MATFITVMDPAAHEGPLLAVKDLIDVAGVPTTAGSRAVADGAAAATDDALCMAGARLGDARVVGKANLFELAYGTTGINEYFGTPTNPLDPDRVPGGSSSGSAVAVATGDADIAYGSDTGGSIRIPSSFCGTAGLKTTHGRISLDGVWPLAPSLDTVGPMARDVKGLIGGMSLLDPRFTLDAARAGVVGRLRVPGVDVDPAIDDAVDRALARAELEVVTVAMPEWSAAHSMTGKILDWEAARANARLTENPDLRAKLSPLVAGRLEAAWNVTKLQFESAMEFRDRWAVRLAGVLSRVELLAGPTVGFFAPLLGHAQRLPYTIFTNPVNLAGLPALVLPVPGGALPAGLQLVGPLDGEALLLATGMHIERAVS